MENKEIIEILEEYLQSGMWKYTEPDLGKEECELFLKYLKQEEEKSKNKIMYRGVAIYKTEHGYEPSVSATTLGGCKNFLDVMFDGIRYYPLRDICTTPREEAKSCLTCVQRIDEYNCFNEVGIGCALDKKVTSLFDVDKGCKYYE